MHTFNNIKLTHAKYLSVRYSGIKNNKISIFDAIEKLNRTEGGVLVYMLENMDLHFNLSTTNREVLSNYISKSTRQVYRAMELIQELDYIRVLKGNTCMINPKLIYYGKEKKYQILKLTYMNDKINSPVEVREYVNSLHEGKVSDKLNLILSSNAQVDINRLRK